MKRSEFEIGEFLYGIPSSTESEQYNPENERVFIHDGYVNGDGYGILLGWENHQIKTSSGYGNFMGGGKVRRVTNDEKEIFIEQIHNQENINKY